MASPHPAGGRPGEHADDISRRALPTAGEDLTTGPVLTVERLLSFSAMSTTLKTIDYTLITGPLISFGQGATKTIEGFRSIDIIIENVENALEYSKNVLVLCWLDTSVAAVADCHKLKSIQSERVKVFTPPPPQLNDFSNRYKQALGIKYLLDVINEQHSDLVILRLRSDITYFKPIFSYLLEQDLASSFVVSEIQDSFLYLGDFLYATSYLNMHRFVQNILDWETRWIHPSTVHDYTLKQFVHCTWLNRLLACCYLGRLIIFVLAISFKNSRLENYIAIPPEYLAKSKWRGVFFENALCDLFTKPKLLRKPTSPSISKCLKSIKEFNTLYNQLILIPRFKPISTVSTRLT